ncbi:T9SS type B sorting domain-containing protein [Flavobacterium anhuiense]|uniref:T9SS type B sorting domain-containing protein n=1 Tax=Flavobacterium anhuiense TaxID=459526 RepID=UPI000E6D53D2|nr:T9SS type B sorting domain-containing protein [Flavobacterium anhuiense]
MKQKLLLYFILITTSISAQNIQWQNTIGGNGYDWCDFIEKTSDGNYISGGYSYSNISGEKNENTRGQNDFWLFKLDNLTGNLLWQKTIGGSSNDHLVSAKETKDGGYILGGYSSSGISGEKTQNSRGGDDYWIVRLDSNRNIVWDKTFGGTGTDRVTCIIETEDGGYLIGGESDSNISGDKTENSKGGTDIWLIKIDNLGTIVWQKTLGGDNFDLISEISQTNDHKYILAASSSSNISGDKTQNSKGIADYWILKLDLNGSIVWQNTIGGNNGDYAKSVIVTADGNYLIGGDSSSRISGDKTENVINNSTDVWLIKINGNGQLIWQKNLGGDSTEIFANMRATADNGLILGVMSYSGISGIKTETSRGDRDYWIVKLDANNALEWDKSFGGSSLDQTQSIIQSSDGSYVIAGWSQSDISGDKTEDKSGSQDFWILKFSVCNTSKPTADSQQSFCTKQNATLSDIQVIGQNIKWFDTFFSASVLPETTLLENRIYYASQTLNNCESGRLPITVKIQDTPIPSADSPQQFCIQKNAKISDIEIDGRNIKWYESSSSTNNLSESTLLENGITYYASQTENTCESDRIPVTINILEATSKNCINLINELPYPKFFTPNGDGFNDTWTIDPDYLAPNSSIRIFDRYGKLIKELALNTSWNGTYLGNQEPASDYWFTATRINGTEYRGHFTLKR